jgi:hypothetical protein
MDVNENSLVASEVMIQVFVRIKILVVWVTAPCNLASLYQRL